MLPITELLLGKTKYIPQLSLPISPNTTMLLRATSLILPHLTYYLQASHHPIHLRPSSPRPVRPPQWVWVSPEAPPHPVQIPTPYPYLLRRPCRNSSSCIVTVSCRTSTCTIPCAAALGMTAPPARQYPDVIRSGSMLLKVYWQTFER